jgi:hypothetical protein
VTAAAAGCAAGSGQPVSVGTAPSVTLPDSSASAGAATSTAAGGGATSSPTAAGGGSSTPECGASVLRVSTASGGAGAGHVGLLIKFTNTGSTTCFMQGYPGAALKLPGGRTLNAQRSMSGYLGGDYRDSTPPYVTVHAGSTVSALLEWSDVPTGNSPATVTAAVCPGVTSTGLLVTPPDTTVSAGLSGLQNVCQGFSIHPVIPVVENALNS